MIELFLALMFVGSIIVSIIGLNSKSVDEKCACIIILFVHLFIVLMYAHKGHNHLDYHKKRVEELTQQKKEKIEQLKQEVEK